MDLLIPGSSLGRYQLLVRLREDEESTVWSARFATSGASTVVEIEVPRRTLGGVEGDLEAFTTEALHATVLRHPNVLDVLDFDEEAGIRYVVSPHVEAETLGAVMPRAELGTGVPLPVAASVITQVCTGLQRVHESRASAGLPILGEPGVSPETILVCRDGTVKVRGFGVSSARRRVGTITFATKLVHARGRARYLAPEELWGEPVNERAEVFGLGVLLYRMTTGRFPFEVAARKPQSLREALLGAPATPPRVWTDGYSEALEGVVLRALALEPDTRYANAAELGEAVSEALAPATNAVVAAYLEELFYESSDVSRRASTRVVGRMPNEACEAPKPPKPPRVQREPAENVTRARTARRSARRFVFGSVAACAAILGVAAARRLGPGADARELLPATAASVSRSVVNASPTTAPAPHKHATNETLRASATPEKPSHVALDESHVDQKLGATRSGPRRVTPVTDFGCEPSCP